LTYLITFSCYGCHLHGDSLGSVDRLHNIPGGALLLPNPRLLADVRRRMEDEPYQLDRGRREAVLGAIQEVCLCRSWELLAAHVRTNHVHIVVQGEARPEKMMHAFKAYASRRLSDEAPCKRWARHGSTRWLWKREEISAAMRYVVEQQGEPMSVFLSEPRR
jgi:REP element-mobilizing transposase RayT